MTDPNLPDAPPPGNGVLVTNENVNDVVENDPKKPWKTVGAFLVPLGLMLINFLTDGSDGGSSITNSEWTTLASTSLLGAAAVFGISNPKRLKVR